MKQQTQVYLPSHLTREISPSRKKRAEIVRAYNERVRDATRMMCECITDKEIAAKHGRFVLADAKTRWVDCWKSVKLDSEGRAYTN